MKNKKKLFGIIAAVLVLAVVCIWMVGVHEGKAWHTSMNIMENEEQTAGDRILHEFSLEHDLTDLKVGVTGCEVYSGKVSLTLESDAGEVFYTIDTVGLEGGEEFWVGALPKGNYRFVAHYTEDAKFASNVIIETFLRGYQYIL